MTDGRKFFDQPISSMRKTYENIRKIATGKGDDYTTGCLLDYPYFKENYKMIAIDYEIWVSFVPTDEFSVRVTKITLRIGVS